MAHHKTSHGLLMMLMISFLVLTLCSVPSLGDDRQVLIKFRTFLSNASALSNWNNSTEICNWNGIKCRKGGFHLILEKMGLSGTIDTDTLLELSNLQSFSVENNNFEGNMPNFNGFGRLKGLDLSQNKFSGDIPDNAFEGMKYLSKVYLDENEFTGHIPSSLAELPNLLDLDLRSNGFEGSIPELKTKNKFRVFNVSNNHLEGEIPGSAIDDPSAYGGNKGLCGKPLNNTCPKSSPSRKRITLLIIAIIVVAVILLASIIAALFVLRRRRRKQRRPSSTGTATSIAASPTTKTTTTITTNIHPEQHQNSESLVIKEKASSLDLTAEFKKGESGDLNFVKKERERFDLQQLLSASAEILGSGSFGSTYKAILLNSPVVVVKRFKHMNNLGKGEFFEHVRRLGRLNHPNLLPLVAFYYRKEEKLLVYDFVENGSLASHLHGRRGSGLDWPTRLKIIKGVARGLAYLYREFPNEKLPHGHLKSSNVLLDESMEPRLTEYGLVPAMNKSHAQQFMAAYKAPEASRSSPEQRSPNNNNNKLKSDVWCLGILILELLTGKFPANYLRHGKGANSDLATWVNSVVREEWTGEVFDKDILGTRNGEGEMLKLLKIGMFCCEWEVENRWDWKEAIAKIEELKEKDSEDDLSSSDNSEADLSYSRDESSLTAPN